MFGDRRLQPRVKINRVARIQAEKTGITCECTISDISEGGARLLVTDVELPDEFVLPTSLTALPVLLRLPQRWQLLNGIGIAGTRWRRPNQNRHLLSVSRGGGVWLADRTDQNFFLAAWRARFACTVGRVQSGLVLKRTSYPGNCGGDQL